VVAWQNSTVITRAKIVDEKGKNIGKSEISENVLLGPAEAGIEDIYGLSTRCR
jgi:hypothetical protein